MYVRFTQIESRLVGVFNFSYETKVLCTYSYYVLTYVLICTTIITSVYVCMQLQKYVVKYTIYTYVYILIIIGVKMSLLNRFKNSLIIKQTNNQFTKNGECSKF